MLLSKILSEQGWRSPVVISNDSGYIVSGHARVKAALLMKDQRVPINHQSFESEEQEWAHLIADNRLAELSEISRPALAELLSELDQSDIDLELTGFDMIDIEKILLNSDLGTGEGEDILSGDENSNTGAKLVQLYFSLNEFEEFTGLIKTLSEIAGTKNTTDTVMYAVSQIVKEEPDE